MEPPADRQTNWGTDLLFVYGSLRSDVGDDAHSLLSNSTLVAIGARMCGKLYQIAEYPGVVDSASRSDEVIGELYSVATEAAWKLLDEYEGCGESLFVRERRPVVLKDGSTVDAWVYLWGGEVEEFSQIPGGDYRIR